MLYEIYFNKINKVLRQIKNTQKSAMMEAGKILANTLENDGLLHVFGCGHSHMISEELFYRAGGLVNVNAIFDTSVMLHEGAVKSSKIERTEEFAPMVFERYKIGINDCLLVTSNSGINGYPIEMAQTGINNGIPVICITSFEYHNESSKHSSGKHLSDICSIAIDNCVPKGDASVEISNSGIKAGPISSFASFFIANSIILIAIEELSKIGITPKLFMSGNIKGGDEINNGFIREKIGVIKHL